MNTVYLSFDDVEGLVIGTGIVDMDELRNELEDEFDYAFDLLNADLVGPISNIRLNSLKLQIKDDYCGDLIDEVKFGNIPVFNSNKEIKASEFFTKEQAAEVISKAKFFTSNYYKKWREGYVSDDVDHIQYSEVGDGEMYLELEIQGEFEIDRLFAIKADVLPFKEDSIISAIGYINPDGTITSEAFEKGDYDFYNPTITYRNEEYSEEEFEEEFLL